MDNNTVINMIPEALEELLYSQEWKDLEVILGEFTRILERIIELADK